VKTKRPNLVWNIDSDPTQTTPVVYHLHGHLDVPELLVLTEDDYLDFLVDLWQSNADPQSANARPMLPMRIQEAVTNASLLFIGYRLADWNFRVILRGLLQRFMPRERYKHVTVQLSPGRGKASKQK